MASATRAGEQERLLRHDAEPVPEGGQVVVAHVDAVHEHGAAGDVVEAREQFDQCGLPGAGLADEGDGLAGRQLERDAADRVGGVRAVAEPHVAEGDPALEPARHRDGVGPLRRRRRRAQQVADPAEAHRRLLVAVEHLGQLLDRREEHVDVEQEGDQRARAERAGGDHLPADGEHECGGDHRQELYEREVRGDVALRAVAGDPVGVAAAGEAGCVVRLTAVRLGDPHAGHVLLQVGMHDADPLAGLAVCRGRLGPEDQGRDQHHRHGAQHDQAELEVQDQQRAQDADERQRR